jgi:hypothetical protein
VHARQGSPDPGLTPRGADLTSAAGDEDGDLTIPFEQYSYPFEQYSHPCERYSPYTLARGRHIPRKQSAQVTYAQR